MYRPTAVECPPRRPPRLPRDGPVCAARGNLRLLLGSAHLGRTPVDVPVPLRREPNQAAKFNALLAQYGPDDVDESSAEGTLIANLVAFEVWQRTLIDVQTWRRGQRAVAAVVERDAMVEACGGSDEGAAAARETARRAAAP